MWPRGPVGSCTVRPLLQAFWGPQDSRRRQSRSREPEQQPERPESHHPHRNFSRSPGPHRPRGEDRRMQGSAMPASGPAGLPQPGLAGLLPPDTQGLPPHPHSPLPTNPAVLGVPRRPASAPGSLPELSWPRGQADFLDFQSTDGPSPVLLLNCVWNVPLIPVVTL